VFAFDETADRCAFCATPVAPNLPGLNDALSGWESPRRTRERE
jgi:hypothetical protein